MPASGSGVNRPKLGQSVTGDCIICGRPPKAGETYGTEADQWDFTNICPQCWDNLFKEE